MDHRENSSQNDRPDTPSANPLTDSERLRKIERLKQSVADGSYHVSADDLARKLIEHMLQPKLEPHD